MLYKAASFQSLNLSLTQMPYLLSFCIKRPPLLSSGGHPVAVLCLSFFVIFTGIKRAPFNVMETKPYVILYAI